MTYDLARIHIRYYEPGAIITAEPLIRLRTNPSAFGMYKRAWYPLQQKNCSHIIDEKLFVHTTNTFMIVTPIGLGSNGMLGDLDGYLSDNGLRALDIKTIMRYGFFRAKRMSNFTREAVFIAAFQPIQNGSSFKLAGALKMGNELKSVVTTMEMEGI